MTSVWDLSGGTLPTAEADAVAGTGFPFGEALPDATASESVTAGVIMIGTGDVLPLPRRPDLTAQASPATEPTSPNKIHVRFPVIMLVKPYL